MDAHAVLHPTEQTLSSFALGKLDDASSEAVNEHLEQCPDCRKRAGEMSADSFLERVQGAAARPESLAAMVAPLARVSMRAGGPTAPAPSPASTLPPGLAEHADYEILRELGRGGMGVVYLARNKLMGRAEVLKVVGGHLIERPGVRDRFLREVQSAAKLQHKNIVTAYSAIRLSESIVLAMEYVEGDDLAKVVKSGGPLPVVQACYFIYQAALGLQHAHERGMVHRDIKPANLILAREGKKAVVKVLDFGLAKVTSEGQADSGLTGEGQMLGTPDYIAPEQIRAARSADIRADIYSLGCTFYNLLTGEPPFRGDSLWDVYQAHFSMDAGPLNLVRPEVPVELAALVSKMMAKEPDRRFQTPGEVAKALVPFFKPGTNPGSGPSPEISRVGHAASSPQTVGGGSAPAQPETPGTAPAPAPRGPAKANPEGVAWESLIEFKEAERSVAVVRPKLEVAPTSARARRPPWVWASVATGVLLCGLVVASVMIFRTKNGTIVFENLPEQSVVTADGDTFEVEWPDGKGKGHAQIKIPRGKHWVEVKVNGVQVSGEFVIVESGGVRRFVVRVEPPPGPIEASTKRNDGIRPRPFDPKQFTIDHGQWIVKGDELLQTEDQVYWPCLLFGDDQWTDYDFTVDLMRLSGTGPAFLVVRGADKDNNFTFDNPGWGTSGVITITESGKSRPLRSVACRFESLKWYTALVRVRGSQIECTLRDGDNEVVNLKVDDTRHARGRVGLRTWEGSTFRFRNIRVTAPDGRTLWEGPPAIESPKPAGPAPPRTNANAWSTLMAKLGRQSSGPAPYACWTFESDERDDIGSLHGRLLGGAAVREGRLYLDGKTGHMRTETLSQDIREKTLEAWVLLGNLDQRGGGVISIEHAPTFDAIVFGEREPKKWIAGSEWFRRTQDLDAPVEHAKSTDLIHLAVVYDLEGGITVYREGKRYAERYVPRDDQATLSTYPADESYVLFGKRATRALDNAFLTGAIKEARLYNRALTADEVAASYRAGIIQHITENGVNKSSATGTAAVRSAEGEPPVPPAAEPMKTNARALTGKTPATRRRSGGSGKADIAAPFRVATNGLAGRQFIDPLSSWPDPHGFNRPDTMERWATPNDFARLTTRAELVYPTLPVSRFVCEVEVTPNAIGDMNFTVGDAENACQICLFWIPERKIIRCWLAHWYTPTWHFGGERTFDPNHRISLKLVVGDGRQTLFHENKPVLSNACWPVDCRLRIFSGAPDSAVVHRCSLRPLTAEDVAACGWSTPPTELRLNPDEAAARLAKISDGYSAKPKFGERFAVKTTGTPMAWIPPGGFMMGTRNPKDEGRHRVRLTRGYWMAQVEVTQGEFSKVTGANPSRVTGSPRLPVDWVAWDQATAYCRKLTALEYKARRLPPGYEYRLPTEAEWEYGSRAGSDEDFSVPEKSAWWSETSGWRPHEVAESPPNKWGLYDMHGNAMEWCFDAWYEFPKGATDETVDPFKIGNPETDTFVVRGGAGPRPHMCSSHWRARNHSNANGFRGFRIVLGPAINSVEH